MTDYYKQMLVMEQIRIKRAKLANLSRRLEVQGKKIRKRLVQEIVDDENKKPKNQYSERAHTISMYKK